MEGLFSHICAFFITTIVVLILIPLSHRIGLLDRPDQRKQHHGATPLVGGLAMFAGLAASFFLLEVSYAPVVALVFGCFLILTIGVIDDILNLSAKIRFSFQIIAALLMIYWAGVSIVSFDKTFFNYPLELGIFAVPFTVFAVVGAINAINMSDGIDGLAGSLCVTILFCLGLAAYVGGAIPELAVLSLVAVIVVAFLTFNFPIPGRAHATIFMGDGGSMMLGFIVAWFSISLTQGEEAVLSPVTALWILGLPVIDTVAVMSRRIIRGRSPFAADREHFHHILLVAGFSRGKAVVTIATINLLLGMVGLTADYYGVPEYIMFYLYLTLLCFYFWGMMHAWRAMQLVKRLSS